MPGLRRRRAEPATEPAAAVEPDPTDPVEPTPDLPAPRRKALTAAAAIVQMDGVGWRTWKFGDQAWQAEGWRMYDLIGVLRQYANWKGAAISRCRLYVAEVGDSGEGLTETEDPEVASLASGPLGRGPAKDESLRLLGICMSVPGESYIVAEDRDGEDDLWYVVSGGEIRRLGGDIIITRPAMYGLDDELKFRPGIDLLIRCWTPHPRKTAWADSPVRAAIPVLRTIEAAMKRRVAELDSRLLGAGLLFLPDGVDFPRGDDTLEGVDGLTHLLQDAMATSIQDRSSAKAMVPIMATVPADSVDKIKHLTFWSELSEHLQPMEDALFRRLANELDISTEQLLGVGDANHWCTDERTEVLTVNGWRRHDQVSPGDVVLTLNHETGLSEWQPATGINRWQVDSLDMVSIEGRYHSSLTTSNHRWPVLRGSSAATRQRTFTTTDALRYDDFLITGAPCGDLPAQAKYDDAFVELMAWYFTEGSHCARAGRSAPIVKIYQSTTANPDHVARIRRALTVMYGSPADGVLDSGGRRATDETLQRRQKAAALRDDGCTVAEIAASVGVSKVQVYKDLRIVDGLLAPRERVTIPRWRMTTKANGMAVFLLNVAASAPFVEMAPNRMVPLDFIRDLTASQLDLFVDTAVRGDGHVMPGGTKTISQKNPAMLDAFELAAVLSGRSVTRRSNYTQGFTLHLQHNVSVRDRSVYRPSRAFPSRPYESTSRVSYTGTIWCPTTPNGTWLARRNGSVYFTGNSAWLSDENNVKIFIGSDLSRIADSLTTGYLRAALEMMGRDPDAYVYAFDTSPLTKRPDRTADGLTYHTAGLISDDAARRSGAFEEEDAPTPEERLRRLVESAIPSMPQLLGVPAIAQLLGVPEIGILGAIAGMAPAVSDSAPPQADEPRAIPDRPSEPPSSASLLAVANLAVLHALSRAGIRLVPRHKRVQWSATPRHQLHTRHGLVGREQADEVLSGAWDDLPSVAADLAVDAEQLREMLHGFCVELLTRGMAYDPVLLRDLVGAAVRGRRLDGPVKAVA